MLRIRYCRCCGSGHFCGIALIPRPRMSTATGVAKKKKKKKSWSWEEECRAGVLSRKMMPSILKVLVRETK